MEKIYKQFEEGFKKHITGEEWENEQKLPIYNQWHNRTDI